MKYILPAFICLVFFSCNKDVYVEKESGYIKQIRVGLKDKLSIDDYKQLDFYRPIKSIHKNGKILLRIGFKEKIRTENFVLLDTDSAGNILKGKIVNLKRIPSENLFEYNGSLVTSSLDRLIVQKSVIDKGFILNSARVGAHQRSLVEPSPRLPDVVVTGYRQNTGNFSFETYFRLMSIFDDAGDSQYGGGGDSGEYNTLDPGMSGGSGGNGSGNNSGGNGGRSGGTDEVDVIDHEAFEPLLSPPILIDFEYVESNPPINIEKYLKCFGNIPDAGSTCSIEIFTDIPVDKDPSVFFDWTNSSPGHTFLRITKSNANQSVQQNIGFYPTEGWKSLVLNDVTAKLADNKNHEYNAGLKMNLSAAELHTVLTRITHIGLHKRYDLDDYNCTDMALEVFNSVRLFNGLSIPQYHIPSGIPFKTSNTPQGLYDKLVTMKLNSPEAANVILPGAKAFTGNSKGECN